MKNMEDRRSEHLVECRRGSSYCFHKALRKYGPDSFEWTIVFVGEDADELYEVEHRYIVLLNTQVPSGYNMTDGGKGIRGLCLSEEARQHMSESKKRFLESERGKVYLRNHIENVFLRKSTDRRREGKEGEFVSGTKAII